ncbi:MAG: metallophosphoesterase [Opitutae bacterium]|nr:metallophosphoesterase [Opitutae bacterium]
MKIYLPLCLLFTGCLFHTGDVDRISGAGTLIDIPDDPGLISKASVEYASGIVYHDSNRNQQRDRGESGIPNVGVSNGLEIVETDARGRWRLPSSDDSIFFVLKPSGWMTPLNEHQLPRFHYIHKPNGSPPSRFPGTAPTGALPNSIDFPLHRQSEPGKFRAVFFGDPQPRNQTEVDYIANDVVAELIGTDARFGVTLGDILFDDLSLFGSLNSTIALVGIPWFNVIGNHDLNREALVDHHSDETFESVYGPPYYSFDYGKVHFIVLDNVDWHHDEKTKRSGYRGGLGERQLQFVANDLSRVSDNKLVVLMMHIPLTGTKDRKELYRLIDKRPYTLSISGHTHRQTHTFIGESDGWEGKEPHHHIVNVTVSGSWWKGAKDDRGIPHAIMSDGAPNGYSLITFDGHRATFDFKAARFPASHQLRIHAPVVIDAKESGKTQVYVNVFSGSVKSTVRMRVNRGDWIELKKTREVDPYYIELREAEIQAKSTGLPMGGGAPSDHLWKGILTCDLPAGTHLLSAVTKDMYDREYSVTRVLRVK